MHRSPLLETVGCSLCFASNALVVDRRDIWRIMQCSQCGMMYLNPRLTQRALLDKVYNDGYAPRLIAIDRIAGERVANARMAFLRRLTFPARHLDIGCGLGTLVRVCRDNGFDSLGVDINPGYGGPHLIPASALFLPFPSHSFDLITLNDIVEHVYDIHAFAEEIRRVLKRDGRIVSETPHCDSAGFRESGARWPNNPLPEHVQFWTPATFAALWRRHRLDVLSVDFECCAFRGEPPDAIFRCVIGRSARRGFDK